MKRTVSIISACRNESEHISAFLDSLLNQNTEGLDCEILIADGASDDATRLILAEYQSRHPRIRVIDNPGRIVSSGLNTAIRESKGEFILRMDAHTEYAPDYVLRCVELLERTGADNVGGPARTRAGGFWAEAIAAAYQSPFSTGGARFHNDRFEGWVDTVPYGCWRRSLFHRIGMFDEALVRNQDDEMNLRIIRAGGRVWQSPDIVSWYYPRSRISALFRQYFQYGYWKVAVIRKHRLPASWRHLAPGGFIIGMATLLLACLGFKAAACPAAAAWSARIWFAAAAIYCLACVLASVFASRKCGWRLLPALPAVFASYHVSYGLGFLLGALRRTRADYHPGSAQNLFTAISR